MLNKAVLALVAGLVMAAPAQAATVTLPLNYRTNGNVTDFLVLGFADYLASPGIGGSQREEIPISGSLNGGFELPSVVFPAQVGWHAFTKLPGLPGGPSTNVWETNTPGPPGFPIELTSFGRLTEDHFSLMLFVQCFNVNCVDLPVQFPFSITFTTPDGVSIIPTPIPAALPMFAAGLGLLWFARRRARRAAATASRASMERR